MYTLVATLDIWNTFNFARWDHLMRTLERLDVLRYLLEMVTRYFTDSIFKYYTESCPNEYRINGGVPQGFLLGSLL